MTFSTDILKNPEIFQINTCKPHSSHIHYRSAAECKEQQSSFFLSLNGDWKFFYSENLNALPEHFEQVGYDDSNWDTIPVPGHSTDQWLWTDAVCQYHVSVGRRGKLQAR